MSSKMPLDLNGEWVLVKNNEMERYFSEFDQFGLNILKIKNFDKTLLALILIVVYKASIQDSIPSTPSGVPFILRATMLRMSLALRISHDEERWQIETKSSMLNRRMQFTLGQEFSDGGEARDEANRNFSAWNEN